MVEVAEKKWYVIRAVTGQEVKIKDYILTEVTRVGLDKQIEDMIVPTEKVVQIRKGKKVSKDITEAIVVPGSGMVKAQAEEEGLDKIFVDAGFLWRDPGCSMCLGMNPDQLKPYERCASTSNRNFEGRQGNLGRTHLMSPLMAALTAINGKIIDPSSS